MNKSVGIIIPMYNLWQEMTKPCLVSLAQNSDLSEIHVYLVDNGSEVDEEEVKQFGRHLFSDSFTYYKLEKNFGFAYACNIGARLVQQKNIPYLFFLNNDTILTKNWLFPLMQCLKDRKIAAVSPLLLFPQNKRVQHAGVSLNPVGGMRHIYYNFPANHELVQRKRYLHYISGAAFLIPTQLFFDAGLFCEDYVNGVEDIDLCCTLTKMGYLLSLEPKSNIYHYGSQSFGRSDANAKNFELFQSRHELLVYDDPLIAQKDGYIPSLTEELQYYLRLSEEKNEQYKKVFVKSFNSEMCLKILEKEPLFIEGYERLALYFEKEKQIEKACYYRELALSFCPTKENYEKLIDSFEKAGDCNKIACYKAQLTHILAKKSDFAYQDKLKKQFIELAKINPLYQKIYEERGK